MLRSRSSARLEFRRIGLSSFTTPALFDCVFMEPKLIGPIIGALRKGIQGPISAEIGGMPTVTFMQVHAPKRLP
jgi:hypothetical protein